MLELIGTGVMLKSLLEAFEIAQTVSDIMVSGSMAGIDLQTTLESNYSLFFALQLVKGVAAVVKDICKFG